MNLLDLFVKISCKDEASSKLSGIASGITGTMSKAAGVVSAVMGSAAVAGAVAIGKSALEAYASYEQLVGGVETLFGESAGVVQQYAANAYKTAGVSANSYMEQATAFSASLIQSLGGDTQKAAEYANLAISDMSDNANKMGTSIDSIQMTYQSLMRGNYAMLDNLKLGYGGTKAELERLVSDAEKLTGQALDPSKFSDIITAIHAVQESMGITGTTALEAATTIEGSVNTAKAAWENWLAGLGDENADISALTDQLVESVTVAAGNIVPRIGQILSTAVQVVVQRGPEIARTLGSSLLSLLPGELSTAFDSALQLWDMGGSIEEKVNLVFSYLGAKIEEYVPGLGSAFSSFGEVVGEVAQLIQDNLGPAMEVGGQVLGAIGDVMQHIAEQAASVLAPAIEALSPVLTDFVNALQPWIEPITNVANLFGNILVAAITAGITVISGIIQVITTVLNAIVDFDNFLNGQPSMIGNVVNAVINWFAQLPGNIASFLSSVISSAGAWVVSMADKAQQAGSQFLSNVSSFVSQLPGNVASFLSNALSSVASFVGSFASKAIEAGSQFLSNIVSELGKVPGRVLSIGQDIVRGVWNGISGMASWFTSQVSGFFGGIVDSAKAALGIASPSKVMRALFKFVPMGAALGIDDEAGAAEESMGGMVGRMLSAAKAGVDAVGSLFSEPLGVASAYSAMTPEVVATGSGSARATAALGPDGSDEVVEAIRSLHDDLGRIIGKYTPTMTTREARRVVKAL